MKFLIETEDDGKCKLSLIDTDGKVLNILYCQSIQDMVRYLEVIITVPIAA